MGTGRSPNLDWQGACRNTTAICYQPCPTCASMRCSSSAFSAARRFRSARAAAAAARSAASACSVSLHVKQADRRMGHLMAAGSEGTLQPLKVD